MIVELYNIIVQRFYGASYDARCIPRRRNPSGSRMRRASIDLDAFPSIRRAGRSLYQRPVETFTFAPICRCIHGRVYR